MSTQIVNVTAADVAATKEVLSPYALGSLDAQEKLRNLGALYYAQAWQLEQYQQGYIDKMADMAAALDEAQSEETPWWR